MKILHKYKNLMILSIILLAAFILYDTIFKSYALFTWILADALFGAGLVLLALGLIFFATNKGGYASIRYYFQKKKDKKENKQSIAYADFIQEEGVMEYKPILFVSILFIILSFIFSYI